MSLVWKSDLFTESLGTHDYPMIGGGGERRGEGGGRWGDRKGGVKGRKEKGY